MMPGLPQYIEPLRLAESRDSISGCLEISTLPRVRSQLHGAGGTVEFRLEFGKDDRGIVRIQGEFHAGLTVSCQRCLEPLGLDIRQAINVALVAGALETEKLPGQAEPLTLIDGQVHLPSFIEDEVLLAMPMVPRHEPAKCPSHAGMGLQPARENPFAVLKGLHQEKN